MNFAVISFSQIAKTGRLDAELNIAFHENKRQVLALLRGLDYKKMLALAKSLPLNAHAWNSVVTGGFRRCPNQANFTTFFGNSNRSLELATYIAIASNPKAVQAGLAAIDQEAKDLVARKQKLLAAGKTIEGLTV